MDVLGILKQYLIDNGYDGLHTPGECACKLDDLWPCGEDLSLCEPGYLADCKGCNHYQDHGEECPYSIDMDAYDFCITTEKREPNDDGKEGES